eukprot:scaffold6042_cov247-Ochromonas_danica.AAC.4
MPMLWTVKWQQGYALCGFYLFAVVSAVYIIMHLVLTWSFAEMISIVPFSGGGYAYSRCSLGPSFGYFAALVELGKYIIYTSTSITRIGLIFQDCYQFSDDNLIYTWLIFFAAVNILHLFDMKLIWVIIGATALATLAIQLMFVAGAIEKGTINNIEGSKWNSDGEIFLQGFPFAAYLIVSSDAVRTCVDDGSKKAVPLALIHVVIWSALIAFATMVSQSSYVYDDSSLAKGAYAYKKGFLLMFPDMDPLKIPFFALPGTIGCSFGFLYCTARQMKSMARSGLLPPILAWGQKTAKVVGEDSEKGTTAVVPGDPATKNQEEDRAVTYDTKPTLALLVCSSISFTLMTCGYFKLPDPNTTFTHAGSLLRCIQYWFLMTAYIVFSTRFSGMTREITSPFGIIGAVCVIGFFFMMFVAEFYYDDDSQGQGIMLAFYFGLAMIYYVLVVQHRQFFSKEEQDKFLKAYIVNANKNRRSRGGKKEESAISAVFKLLAGAVPQNKVKPGSSKKSSATAAVCRGLELFCVINKLVVQHYALFIRVLSHEISIQGQSERTMSCIVALWLKQIDPTGLTGVGNNGFTISIDMLCNIFTLRRRKCPDVEANAC